MFSERLTRNCELPDLLGILCAASEYDELPVRHNEDKVAEQLVELLRWSPEVYDFEDPHLKASILFQGHLQHMEFPINDFYTDQKSVLDQAIRILQAMVDVSAEAGWLGTALKTMLLVQMIIQARWLSDSTLLNLPGMSPKLVSALWSQGVEALPELLHFPRRDLLRLCKQCKTKSRDQERLLRVIAGIPLLDVTILPLQGAVLPGEDLELTVSLVNRSARRGDNAHAPFFKTKKEGWWLVLGQDTEDDLLALKRVMCRGRTQCTFRFTAPATEGDYVFTVFLMSDTYIGLDQQYSFSLCVDFGDGPEGAGEDEEEEEEEEGE